MSKFEIQSEIDNVEMELRSLMNDVKDASKDVNVEEVRAKKAELETKRSSLVKELAECDRPVEAEKEVRSGWNTIAENMQKRANTTLSGTGNVKTVKELVKGIQDKYDLVNRARFFYGPDAATNIPVWGTGLTAAFQGEGGTGTAPANQLGVKQVQAKEALATLPVSNMALKLSGADLEAELPGIFAESFGQLMVDGIINGKTIDSGNTVCMDGLFAASNGATAYFKACSLSNLANLARTIGAKNYANPVIIMSPTVYAMFVADSSSGEDIKIYKECLIRDKMIEDVPVLLTNKAPASGSGASGAWADNDVIAVAGDLSNYAIAVAGQIDIAPKGTAGTTVTTFDATSYFAGKMIVPADFYQYKIDA